MPNNKDYNFIYKFIDTYSSIGFKGIDNQDLFMKRLNKQMEINNQFFFITDLIKLQILYTSPHVKSILGVQPEQVDPAYLVSVIHPSDSLRLSRGFIIALKQAREIFNNKSGTQLLSSNFRRRKTNGVYTQCLVQIYLFYCKLHVETVYALEVNTPVDDFAEIQNSHYHWYIGNDLNLFRYPDKNLLRIGSVFSDRELEIIQQIQAGLKTKQIADRLFLSPATISTHRKNILKKGGKATIAELIFELTQTGIIA